jgi:hypothetical protein
MVVLALTKSRYWFLNFSDRPFNYCTTIFLKFSFCLIKPALLYIKLATRRIPIWYPARSAMYIEGSLLESWYPERQSSEDRLVSCAPMVAPTACSDCDRSAPDTNSLLAHRMPMESCKPTMLLLPS